MTHRQAILRVLPGCYSRKDGQYDWSIFGPNGKMIASGVSAQQAWYLARIVLMQGIERFTVA